MTRFFRPFNTFIFITAIILTVLSFYWLSGYQKAKKQDENISFLNYIKADTEKIKESLKTIPDILKESAESGDKIKIGSLNKIAEALELYQLEYGHYPEEITSLLGTYINKKTKIFQEESFYYYSRNGGYEMGIKLGNGEIYKIKN